MKARTYEILILLALLALLLFSAGCATESGRKQQQWCDAMKGLRCD